MSEEQEPQKTVSKEFVSSIKKWVSLDDDIKKLREKMKLLSNEKKELEVIILSELDKMEEKVIEITDGKLRKNVSKTQTPLKKDHIAKTIQEFTKDDQKTHEIIDYMMKSRQVVERINLKRTKNRGEHKVEEKEV
jgi:hypothetical protein